MLRVLSFYFCTPIDCLCVLINFWLFILWAIVKCKFFSFLSKFHSSINSLRVSWRFLECISILFWFLFEFCHESPLNLHISYNITWYENRYKPYQYICEWSCHSTIDYQKYTQHFIFVPPEVIKHTFKKTTQFYWMSANPSMKKTFRTPFPACNVHRRSEAVATDTVYSDTPAIDSGITAAQFFCWSWISGMWYPSPAIQKAVCENPSR